LDLLIFNKTQQTTLFLKKPTSILYYLSIFSLYKNGLTDVCLSVGMWRANGNPNPCTDLDKILNAHPHLFKVGFSAGLTLPPPTPWPGGA